VAQVEPVFEPAPESLRDAMRPHRQRLEALLVPQPVSTKSTKDTKETKDAKETKVPSSMADEDLVNALAQYLEFEPVEKQALLERDGLLERCRSLIELLEMKVLVARHPWNREGTN
jgi:Lon protease-like protein